MALRVTSYISNVLGDASVMNACRIEYVFKLLQQKHKLKDIIKLIPEANTVKQSPNHKWNAMATISAWHAENNDLYCCVTDKENSELQTHKSPILMAIEWMAFLNGYDNVSMDPPGKHNPVLPTAAGDRLFSTDLASNVVEEYNCQGEPEPWRFKEKKNDFNKDKQGEDPDHVHLIPDAATDPAGGSWDGNSALYHNNNGHHTVLLPPKANPPDTLKVT